MTVRRLYDNLRYIGLASDAKPTLHIEEDGSIVTGAEFYETDTQDTYLWDGDGWKRKYLIGCVQDYLDAIAEGDIYGHTQFLKLGYSAGGTTTETDVWGGASAYVFPTAAQQMQCISSSVEDNAAGTGVKTVRIYYLKSDYTEATTDVVLTGQVAALTSVSDIFRVNNFRVIDFGAGTTLYRAAGAIDVRNKTTTTIVYSRILAGNTRARNSVYTVPHGKTIYITSISCGATKGSATGTVATFTLRATYDDKLGTILTPGFFFMPHAEINLVDGQATREFHVPVKFIAHTDLKVGVICGQVATVCTSSIRGWLE